MRVGAPARWSAGFVLGAVLAFCPAGCRKAAAQSDVNRVEIGDSVWVSVRGYVPVAATFASWQGENMMLNVDGLSGQWPVSIFDMIGLRLYTMRTRQESFRDGAMLGGATGLFAGAALGLLLHSVGAIGDPEAPPAQLMTHTLAGAGLGFVGGLFAGGFYYGRNPGLGWVSITLPAG